MKFLLFLCVVPLFRYAEVQIDPLHASSYSGKFRLKLVCFAGKPYVNLWEDYLASPVEVEMRKVNYIKGAEGPPSHYVTDVQYSGFADMTMNFFLNVDPDSYYKIKINRKGLSFWRPPSTTEIEFKKYYKRGTREPNMILHIR